MEKFNIRMRNSLHKNDVHVGSNRESIAIRLRRRIAEMDVVIRELPIRTDISARNAMILSAHDALTTLYKAIYPDDNSLVLDTSCGRWVTRTIFEKCNNAMEIDSVIADPLFSKFIDPAVSEAVLGHDMILVIRELFCQCENILELTNNILDENGVCLEKTTKAYPSMRLGSASNIGSSAVKRLNIENISSLRCLLRDTAIALLGVEDTGLGLYNNDVYANLTRYRMLGDMDNLNLDDFDSLKIIDVDYITI